MKFPKYYISHTLSKYIKFLKINDKENCGVYYSYDGREIISECLNYTYIKNHQYLFKEINIAEVVLL